MKKKIVLIGLNLYSIFLALQIRSKAKYDEVLNYIEFLKQNPS